MKMINADELPLLLVAEGQEKSSKYGFKLGDTIKFSPSQIQTIIKDMESVELIRCKDCKHYVQLNPRQYAVRNKEGKFIGYKMVQDPPYCTEWSQEYEVNMKPDDFCSHAERTE